MDKKAEMDVVWSRLAGDEVAGTDLFFFLTGENERNMLVLSFKKCAAARQQRDHFRSHQYAFWVEIMDLLYKNEKPLFTVSLIMSVLFWLLLIIGTAGTILVWILLFFISYLFVQSGLIAYLKGTAVEITPQQFPDLYKQLRECCSKLEISDIPDAYMFHADGAFNAFATRFLKKNYIVLFSDVVDALEANEGALKFYFGHELGHIHRKHLFWGPILSPAGLLPLLGAA